MCIILKYELDSQKSCCHYNRDLTAGSSLLKADISSLAGSSVSSFIPVFRHNTRHAHWKHASCTTIAPARPQDRQSASLFSINFLMKYLHVCACSYRSWPVLITNSRNAVTNYYTTPSTLFTTSVMKKSNPYNVWHESSVKLHTVYGIIHKYAFTASIWNVEECEHCFFSFGNEYWETNACKYAKFDVVTKYINIWHGSWETVILEQEQVAVAREQPINTVPLQRTHAATLEELLQTMFSIGSDPKLYIYSIQPALSFTGLPHHSGRNECPALPWGTTNKYQLSAGSFSTVRLWTTLSR
jgi:hypothetical protein